MNKWTKNSIHLTGAEETEYRECVIVRSKAYRGYFYYVFHSEHIYWAAPHSKMSTNFKSLKSAKNYVDYLLNKESSLDKDVCIHVHRFNLMNSIVTWDLKLKKLKSMYPEDESLQYLCDKRIAEHSKFLSNKSA